MRLSEMLKKIDSTGCVKTSNPLILTNNYTLEQKKSKLEEIKAKSKIKAKVKLFKDFEFRLKTIERLWNFESVSNEIVSSRIDIEKQLFQENVMNKTGKQIVFEKKLIKDIIAKTCDDIGRNKIIKSKEFYEKIDEDFASYFIIPPAKDNSKAELKSIEEIKKYLYEKIKSYYKGEFNYPEEEGEVEELIETIGV